MEIQNRFLISDMAQSHWEGCSVDALAKYEDQ